jgi:hypothetical protein
MFNTDEIKIDRVGEFADTDNYFCLDSENIITFLGNHGDIEAAEDTAESLGLDIVSIFGEDSARSILSALQVFF